LAQTAAFDFPPFFRKGGIIRKSRAAHKLKTRPEQNREAYMRRNARLRRGFWFAPAALGLVLIAMGLLIFYNPLLLAYVVAGTFVFGGVVLLSLAMQMRSRVSYHRIDSAFRGPQSPAE
jgi:hypothetical protein